MENIEVKEEGEEGEEGERQKTSPIERVGQEQIHGLLFDVKLSWQQIIYDLIRTEQLDPWDIDLGLLANKFLGKVRELEEANFFVSSQVLLAASLLLRLKSEILLNHYIPDLDAILFGRKEESKKYSPGKMELEGEVPGLMLRTPLPRYRKVTLEELMSALGHAIKTENRRIRKVVVARQQEMEAALALPRHRINLKDKIKEVHSKLRRIFSSREEKLAFSELAGKNVDDKVATFIPLLHLDTQHKVWLEQDKHFDEIWILLKHMYERQNAESLENMRKEAEIAIESLVKEERDKGIYGKKEDEKAEGDEDEGEIPKGALEGLTGFNSSNVEKEIEEMEEIEIDSEKK